MKAGILLGLLALTFVACKGKKVGSTMPMKIVDSKIDTSYSGYIRVWLADEIVDSTLEITSQKVVCIDRVDSSYFNYGFLVLHGRIEKETCMVIANSQIRHFKNMKSKAPDYTFPCEFQNEYCYLMTLDNVDDGFSLSQDGAKIYYFSKQHVSSSLLYIKNKDFFEDGHIDTDLVSFEIERTEAINLYYNLINCESLD